MAEDDVTAMEAEAAGRSAFVRILIGFAVAIAVLLAASFLSVLALNTSPGRGFIVSQLKRIAPHSGLTVRVGRIDGSLFSRLTIHDLVLGDPDGPFLTAPQVDLDWRPTQFFSKGLTVNSLDADVVHVLKRPKLRKSEEEGPALPDFDIHVGRVTLDRIILEQPVVGVRHVAHLDGKADIHAGRALVDAHAAVVDGGDKIDLKLDAAPDADKFDIDATVHAPAHGVLTTLAGSDDTFDLKIGGDGNWTRWRGTVKSTIGKASLTDLALSGDDGRFTLKGTAAPGLVFGGIVERLGSPRLALDASAVFKDKRVSANFSAASPVFRLAGKGGVDLGSSNFENFALDGYFLRSDALLRRTTARDMKIHLLLNGALAAPQVDYDFSAAQLALSTTILDHLRVQGRATAKAPLVIPATATVARVTGIGDFVGSLLTNVKVTGPVAAKNLVLTSDELVIRSDRVNGRAVLRFDLRTGLYQVGLNGTIQRYLIPGLGLIDAEANLKVVPGDGGNPHIAGPVTAKVQRLDNGFFLSLAEGLPTLRADLDIPPGGGVRFANMRVTAPGVSLSGQGAIGDGGNWTISATGTSRRYGPIAALRVAGDISHPDVTIRMAKPGQGIGLAGVDAKLTPTSDGWNLAATGSSDYGLVKLGGRVLAASNQPTVIDIASLDIAGVTAKGALKSDGPAMSGTLQITGSGLTGTLHFLPADGVQRVDAAIDAKTARLALGLPTTISRGSLRGSATFYDDAPAIGGKIEVAGLSRDSLDINAGVISGDYRGGRGAFTVSAKGSQGVPFTADGKVAITPSNIVISGSGTVQKRALTLSAPAQLTAVPGGWRLAPVTLILPEGRVTLSGSFAADTQVSARLDGVGLDLLDLVQPDLDLGGRASGTFDMTFPADGGLPHGRANLRVAEFSRAESATVSQPVDISVSAAIQGNAAAAQAIIQQKGVIVGRIQGQLRPIPGSVSDPMMQRLYAAPLFAQARFNGPAGALWPLAGVTAFDVRGPVAIAADLGGHLGEPTISGTIRANGAHLESTAIGAAIDNIKMDGRFSGPRLEIVSFSGTAGKDGTIAGAGSIDLSADRGFPIDLKMNLQNAQVLRRDDLRASATGPLEIKSDKANGGLISGNLKITKANFRIGRTAAEEVPEMEVSEVNSYLVRAQTTRPAKPTVWKLAVTADADNKVQVNGMGLDSEWQSKIKLSGPVDSFSITGSADLIRGTYEFAGRRFDLTRGRLRFTGGYPADPTLDILATNSSEGLTANIQISGTATRPEISFSSTPALPEDEVLSRVLFGSSIANLSAPEALQLAGAVASLRGGQGTGHFDVLNTLRKGIGVDRLRILPGDTTTRTANPQQRRGTTVAAGKYIGNRVYVELASDAQGYTSSQIEVRLTRALSILSQVATFGGTGVNLKLSKDY